MFSSAFSTTPRRASEFAWWMLGVAEVTLVLLVTWALAVSDRHALGLGWLQNRVLNKLVILGFVVATALLCARWKNTASRRLAVTSLVSFTILGLALVAQGSVQTWPTSDGALIELYTINATHGAQLLGAYSQYGWHHPGPLLFYLLAPLYVLGGSSVAALNSGALVINLAACMTMILVLVRQAANSYRLAPIALGFVLLYVLRVPPILSSSWNPHVAILPFGALLVLSAAAFAGSAACLPLVVLFASFVAQTHVAFAPVAVVLILFATYGVVRGARQKQAPSPSAWRWMSISLGVLAVLWLPPVIEQISAPTGNLTLLWRFFVAGGTGQPASVAWRAWASSLAALFAPHLVLPKGWAYVAPGSAWWPIAGTSCAALLCPTAIWARRREKHFLFALAVACLLASLVSLLSVVRIQGIIGDYQVFWLSIVGLMNAAVVTTTIVTQLVSASTASRMERYLATSVATALMSVVLAIGIARIVDTRNHAETEVGNLLVRNLSRALAQLPSTGNRRPLLRFDSDTWVVPAGLALQMARAAIPFSLDSDTPLRNAARPDLTGVVWLYGPRFLTTGDEDTLWIVSGGKLHQELARRPQNKTLAYDEQFQIFVDEVSLVDAPQYRWNALDGQE